MEAKNVPLFKTLATLNAKTSPWLGWEVLFENNLSAGNINSYKPLIEAELNRYLQSKVNVVANNLIVPFNCKLSAVQGNPKLFQFRVIVSSRKLFFMKTLFNYPHGPILSLDNYTIVKPPHVESQTAAVALKPPAL